MEEIKTKTWKIVATYSLFEEADRKRNELLKDNKYVKVKRGGRKGSLYRVKIWTPDSEVKKNKQHKKNKKSKK